MLAMKAARGAGWMVLSRFLGRLIDFVTLLVLARLLAPADFGFIALAMIVISIADIVLELPVTQALTRLPRIDRSHIDTGFTIGLLRGVVIMAAVAAASWPFAHVYNDPNLVPVLLFLAAGPVARGLYSPAMVHFIRQMSFRPAFLAEICGKVCAVILALSVAAAGGGSWAIATNFVAASLASTIASYVIAPYRPSLSLARFSDFASFIGWFSAAQILAAINWQFDRLLLGRLFDRTTLGRFTMASDLAVMPTQSLIGPALQPVMAALSRVNSDPERLRLAVLKAARLTMLISIPVSLGVALTGDLAVTVMLGAKWQEVGPLLQMLALTVLTVPYFQCLYALALAVDRPFVVFRLNAIDLASRLMVIPLGLWLSGIVGVIAGRGVLSVVLFGLCLASLRALTGIGIREQLANLWKIIVAGVCMVFAVLAVRRGLGPGRPGALLEIAACVALGAAVYGGALLTLGVRVVAGAGRFEITDRWWASAAPGAVRASP